MLFLAITLSSVLMVFSLKCDTKSPCRCATSENKVIDLSSVGEQGPRFYQVEFENYTGLYSYNPCSPFNSCDQKLIDVPKNKQPCFEAAICIRLPGNPKSSRPEEYMIGSQSSAQFKTAKNGSVYVEYSVQEPKSTVSVWLVCNETMKDHALEIVEAAGDSTVFRLISKCACFNGCTSTVPVESPPGLSVGSKLLIAFFTILLAYLLVGIFWNYCNGSKGIELIPNIEFWNDVPTLIMEGIAFTCSCCGRQSSYGEV